MNHKHAMFILVVVTTTLAFLAGQNNESNLGIIATKLINGTLTLGVPSLLMHYFRGKEYDVYAEVFDQHNMAAAIMLGFAWLAWAIAVTVVS